MGSVFTLTANKPGAFSVEVNTRTEARFEDDFISLLMEDFKCIFSSAKKAHSSHDIFYKDKYSIVKMLIRMSCIQAR